MFPALWNCTLFLQPAVMHFCVFLKCCPLFTFKFQLKYNLRYNFSLKPSQRWLGHYRMNRSLLCAPRQVMICVTAACGCFCPLLLDSRHHTVEDFGDKLGLEVWLCHLLSMTLRSLLNPCKAQLSQTGSSSDKNIPSSSWYKICKTLGHRLLSTNSSSLFLHEGRGHFLFA